MQSSRCNASSSDSRCEVMLGIRFSEYSTYQYFIILSDSPHSERSHLRRHYRAPPRSPTMRVPHHKALQTNIKQLEQAVNFLPRFGSPVALLSREDGIRRRGTNWMLPFQSATDFSITFFIVRKYNEKRASKPLKPLNNWLCS